jgi:hypothetical protein
MPLRTLPAVSRAGHRSARALPILLSTVAVAAALAAPAAAQTELGWSPTVDLAAPIDGAANLADLAVDADGTAYAAWVRASSSGGPNVIQVATRPRGGTWSTPVAISRAVGDEAGSRITAQPQIAVRDGAVAVGWLQTTPESTLGRMNQAWAAVRTADGRWNAPTALSPLPTPPAPVTVPATPATRSNPASDVAVAVRPGGVATVAFFQDGKEELVTRDGAPDGSWSAPSTVNPGSDTGNGYTDIAVDDNGAATLVWQDYPVEEPAIVVSERRPGSMAWSRPVPLSDPSAYSLFPRLVVDGDDGDADVVWTTRIDETSQFAHNEVQLARREGRDGEWTAPKVLSAPGGMANGRGTSKTPAVALAPDGDLSVAWLRSEGANADLLPDRAQVRTRTADGTWGPIADVWTGLRNPTSRQPTLAVGPGGQATVAVSGYTTAQNGASGPRNVRVVRRETVGGAWSPERTLSVARVGSSTAVSWEIPIVADPLGNVTLVWHQVDATGEVGIQSAGFRVADPVAPTPESTPPTTSPAHPPAVAPAVPPAAKTVPLRLDARWDGSQARRYAARKGLLIAFRGTPGAEANIVVRSGGKVVARLTGARLGQNGRLVRRVRLSTATRRSLLAAKRSLALRVTAKVEGRTKSAWVRLR